MRTCLVNIETKEIDKRYEFSPSAKEIPQGFCEMEIPSGISLGECFDTLQSEMVNDQPIFEGEIIDCPEGFECEVGDQVSYGEDVITHARVIEVDGIKKFQLQSGWTQKEIFVIKVDTSKVDLNAKTKRYNELMAWRDEMIKKTDFVELTKARSRFTDETMTSVDVFREELIKMRVELTIENALEYVPWTAPQIEYKEKYKRVGEGKKKI